MRRSWILSAALVATTALALAPAGGAAKSNKTTQLSCALELYAQGMPNPSGIHFGFVKCPSPFGKGLHYSAYTVTPTGMGTGTVAGTFKNYYNRGTTRGTVALTFAATSPKDITYTGTVTYTGGTGRFKHVKGSGTIQCTSSDGGARKACTVNSTLTGV
ncbi:hypothetical protein BH20ACT17_BH20ACT17_05900 [soil metagenome]